MNWNDVTRFAATENGPDAVALIVIRPEDGLPSEGIHRKAASVGDACGNDDGTLVTVHSNGMLSLADTVAEPTTCPDELLPEAIVGRDWNAPRSIGNARDIQYTP